MCKFLKHIVHFWYEKDGANPLLQHRIRPKEFLRQLQFRDVQTPEYWKNVLIFLGQDTLFDNVKIETLDKVYKNIVTTLIEKFHSNRIVFLTVHVPFMCTDNNVLKRVNKFNSMLYRLKTAFPGVVEIFNYTGVLYTNALSICKLRNIADLRYKPGAFLPHSDSDLFEWTF